MTRSADSWHAKIDALGEALHTHGIDLGVHAQALVLGVAEHETRCGDAWPGEHNWGAVQLRRLSPAERVALAAAGVVAHPNHTDAARAALANAGLAEPNGALHCDSSPNTGYYFVWFWAFATDALGANQLLHTLYDNESRTRAVLQSDRFDPSEMARAMYSSKYFEGFYQRSSWYRHDSAKWALVSGPGDDAMLGSELNIQAYSGAVDPLARAALAAMGSGTNISDHAIDLSTNAGVQDALNRLGANPQLEVDGIVGPKTRAAITAFQRGAKLATADGIAGPVTIAAMRVRLG